MLRMGACDTCGDGDLWYIHTVCVVHTVIVFRDSGVAPAAGIVVVCEAVVEHHRVPTTTAYRLTHPRHHI